MRKNRGGQQGREYPFVPRIVKRRSKTKTASRSQPWLWIGAGAARRSSGAARILGLKAAGKINVQRCYG